MVLVIFGRNRLNVNTRGILSDFCRVPFFLILRCCFSFPCGYHVNQIDLNSFACLGGSGVQILCEGIVLDQFSFLYIFVCNLPLRKYISASRNAMQSSRSMRKDSQIVTKLQHKLFYCFQHVHNDTILISKFCNIPTCGNLGYVVTSLTLRGPSYGQN